MMVAVSGLCFGQSPDATTTVFDENFNAYKDGEHPSSIVERNALPTDSGEVIGGRYAVSFGNRHLLVAPKVRDFDLTFTVEPHPRAAQAPIMIVDFRTDAEGRRGYRIVHWMGESLNRLDLEAWDTTVAPPVRRMLAQPKVPDVRLPVAAPLRFRLIASGNSIVLSRDDEELLAYTDTNATARLAEPGNIALGASLETWVKKEVAPLFFDDVRLKTSDPVKPFRTVYQKEFEVPQWVQAVCVQVKHSIRILEVADTGLDAVRSGGAGGRVYRVDAGINFPALTAEDPKRFERDMALLAPYVRVERANGDLLVEDRIFNGILGGMRPGHGGGSAQLLRLMTAHGNPPHHGAAARSPQAADGTGPQRSSPCFMTDLPDDFTIVAGWDYHLDGDHMEPAGPIEAMYDRSGTLLYVGDPLGVGDRALLVGNPEPKGLLARLTGPIDPNFARRFDENLCFLEGDPTRFTVAVVAGPRTRVPVGFRWRLLDALRRPVEGAEGEDTFGHTADEQAQTLRGIGREKVSADLDLGRRPPGVYWLDLEAGGLEMQRAFSIVPAKREPGNTAARASGLPWIAGQFYPSHWTRKDAGHYVSDSGARNEAWKEQLEVFNMRVIGPPPGVTIPKAEQAFDGGYRLWATAAFSERAVQDFVVSKAYREQPGDAVLRDPKATNEDRQRAILKRHFQAWIDHWCQVHTANDAARRTIWEQHAGGNEFRSYGPPLINTFHYGNLYGGRYYGFDARQATPGKRLVDVYTMETYPHDFGREHASYTPSIALTKMGLPTAGCGWEIYGAGGYVIDNRTALGRPPHGLGYPSRNFIAHHVTELRLGPWYFDGRAFQPAGHTHIQPTLGNWTRQMLFGMIDGLRVSADVANLTPARCTAFVNSWAAADLDPSWQRGVANNAAAEAPAYAYLQSRLAGLAGGFFLDIADIGKLDRQRADMLVLPPMRGATQEQVAAIRRQYDAGMALVCFDDATGLEDLFGVRKLRAGVAIRGVQRAEGDALLAGLDEHTLAEGVAHEGTVGYELAGATEVLSAVDRENRRVAPMLTVHRPAGKPGAVFFAAGATDVSRRLHGPGDLNLEGEVLSPLIQQALRRGLVAVADPLVRVSPPATALSLQQADGGLYVVVMESSWPNSSGKAVEVELTVRGPGAEQARLVCEKPLIETARGAGERRVVMSLQPDEVVGIEIAGMRGER
jgi:hypothetical protein